VANFGNQQTDPQLEELIKQTAARTGKSVQEVARFYGYQPLMTPAGMHVATFGGGGAPLYASDGAAGGGGGGGGDVGNRLTQLMNDANAANAGRWQDAMDINASGKGEQLGMIDSEYGRIFDELDAGVGAQRQRNDMAEKKDLNDARGDMAARGLTNTSLLNNRREQVKDRASLRDRELLADQAQRDVATRGRFVDTKLDTIRSSNSDRERLDEARIDQAPNLSLYAELLGQPGAGGGYTTNYLGGGGGHAVGSDGTGFVRPAGPSAGGPSNTLPPGSKRDNPAGTGVLQPGLPSPKWAGGSVVGPSGSVYAPDPTSSSDFPQYSPVHWGAGSRPGTGLSRPASAPTGMNPWTAGRYLGGTGADPYAGFRGIDARLRRPGLAQGPLRPVVRSRPLYA
jgi:hypothetical protein